MSRCDTSPVPVAGWSTAPRLLRLWVQIQWVAWMSVVCEWCVPKATARIMNGGVVLLKMDYNFGVKHPYRRHRYVLQNVLIMQAVQLTLYTMGNSSPFVGDTAPTVDRGPLHLQVDIYCGL